MSTENLIGLFLVVPVIAWQLWTYRQDRLAADRVRSGRERLGE